MEPIRFIRYFLPKETNKIAIKIQKPTNIENILKVLPKKKLIVFS